MFAVHTQDSFYGKKKYELISACIFRLRLTSSSLIYMWLEERNPCCNILRVDLLLASDQDRYNSKYMKRYI